MYSTIKRFLTESITIKRKVKRDKDLISETINIGTFKARLEDSNVNVTNSSGVTFIKPTKKAFIAEEKVVIAIGDICILPNGEEREVTDVGSATNFGDYRYIEIVL